MHYRKAASGSCLYLVVFVLLVAGAVGSAPAQDPPAQARSLSWTSTGGPPGAFVFSLLTTPAGTVLAGTEDGGIFRSADGGVTWEPSDVGFPWPCCNYAVPSLAAGWGALYAGTWGGGVYRSTDDGVTWEPTGAIPGEGYPIITSLATCAYGDRLYAGGQFGVACSQDAGTSWAIFNDGLPTSWTRGLAVHGTTVYAMFEEGIYRLSPGSASWEEWNDGLPATNGMQKLRSTAGGLFLSTHQGGACHLDCGDSSWVCVGESALWGVDDVVEVDRALYAGTMGNGLYRWSQSLPGWEEVNSGLWNRDIRHLESHGRTILAGTFGDGVLSLDTDAGVWSTECTGMIAPLLTSLTYDGSRIYAGLNNGGVYRSSDQGGTWSRSLTGMTNFSVFALAHDTSGIYAATWFGVEKSTDQGESWSATGLQGHGIFSLNLWSGVIYAGEYEGGVWASANGGTSWIEVGSGLPSGIMRGVVRSGTTLYAAVDGGGVYELPDGQSVWTAMNAGLPGLGCYCLNLCGGALMLGTSGNGAYRWNPGGETWVASGLENLEVFCLTDGGTQILAGTRGELYSSADGGQTWALDNEGLKPWLPVLAIEPAGAALYAGLQHAGVYRSTRPVGVEPDGFDLLPEAPLAVRPNPFSPGARISFRTARAGETALDVYDASGRRVAVILSGELPAGIHEAAWDGTMTGGASAPAGTYWIRLRADGLEQAVKTIRVP